MARIALFLHSLAGGGVQRATLNLARALIAEGCAVDLVVGSLAGPSRARVPPQARLVPLGRCWRWRYWGPVLRAERAARDRVWRPVILPLVPQRALYFLPALVRYLGAERPDALIAAGTYYNLVAIWAKELAGVSTRIVVSERSALGPKLLEPGARRAWRWRFAPPLIARVYPRAHAIVAVSEGLAAELAALGVPADRIATIHNAVFAAEDVAGPGAAHPWLLDGGSPVVLAVGRLSAVKAFDVLIRAFALVRAGRPCRLVILGDEHDRGLRARLLALAAGLGVGAEVDLPGFAENPYASMARAAVLVLSSLREGFPNVLAEALACGCPVVSTDCPHGPADILDRGRFGRLVPVGDAAALAGAIEATLASPPDRAVLRERGAAFGAARAARSYLALLGRS
jgi:glycosyltransferase involved in cell wall biosynthesis